MISVIEHDIDIAQVPAEVSYHKALQALWGQLQYIRLRSPYNRHLQSGWRGLEFENGDCNLVLF